jgi:hypothetical protein
MQENDFRYVFVGIESPDEAVLAETQKRQNQRVFVVDAVRTLTAHGMIVNRGFILGFDSETEHTAASMIDLIHATGIASALVGTLVTLPNTQLSCRLEREGRLFGGGLVVTDTRVDVDNTTSGLNFATVRPRAVILKDHAEVLRAVYEPEKYYERVFVTATLVAPNHKYRPDFATSLREAWPSSNCAARTGSTGASAPLYWKTLFKVS